MPRADLDELERHACPAQARARATSPPTRWRLRSTASIAPIGDGLIPADESDAKDEAATRAGSSRCGSPSRR